MQAEQPKSVIITGNITGYCASCRQSVGETHECFGSGSVTFPLAKPVPQTEQAGFHYFECPECGFDSVQLATFNGSEACPLCAGDSGHDVRMSRRIARETDKPEGKDARNAS